MGVSIKECPSCYFEFETDQDVIAGEVVTCPDCGIDLEVVSIQDGVATVQIAESGEEDWGE
jgi:alpha-aminoadipate carrier protein LysW